LNTNKQKGQINKETEANKQILSSDNDERLCYQDALSRPINDVCHRLVGDA
jgi:hypothetical protein